MKLSTAVGDLRRLPEMVAKYAPRRIMVFSGRRSYDASGAAAAIEPLIRDLSISRVTDVAPNPNLAAVEDAIERHRENVPDLIIAAGGGSVIDLAKSTRSLARQTETPRSIITGSASITQPGVPLIAIPTTAGTGAESTHFSVVYVDGVKHSLRHETVRPDKVIVDPVLTYSVPPDITAHTGLDALSQAIESWWSIDSTEFSRRLAGTAVGYAISSLEDAVLRPNPDNRARMCEASHLAGRAIDITATTAPHALSYKLTIDHGVPHGHAVGLMLGPVFTYNASVTEADCADSRGAQYVRTTIDAIAESIGAQNASEAHKLIIELLSAVGLEPTLDGVGAGSPHARRAIAESVDADRLAGNPRTFTHETLDALLSAIP